MKKNEEPSGKNRSASAKRGKPPAGKTSRRLPAKTARPGGDTPKVESKIESERQRFFHVLETLPAYLVLLSKDYHVPFANKFFRERFGDSQGRCCYEYLFQRAEPCENCESFRSFKTGAPHRWEWRGPDGREYDVYDFPFTDPDGSPLIMEMGIDVTERKGIEAALSETNAALHERIGRRTAELAESELRWATTLSSIDDAVIATDTEGRIRFMNPTAVSLTGWSCREAAGRPIGEVIQTVDEPSRGGAENSIAGVFAAGPPVSTRLIRKDGTEIAVDKSGAPIRGPDGKTTGAVLTLRDLTRRRSDEQTIRNMARFPEENPNPVLRINRAGTILYANRASGLLGDERLAQIGGRIPPEWLALAERAFSTQEKVVADVAAGREILLLTIAPMADEGYANLYGVAITERRKEEQELARLNRILKAISESNQAMMRARKEIDFMEDACRIIVESCGHAMVWIGMAEQDEGKAVRPVACSGFEDGYLEKLDLTWADSERGRGPTGTAIRTGKASLCRNMLTDPAFAPWRAEALKRGFASSIALPLLEEERAFGAVMIYSREPDPFSDDEVALLSELATDLSHGIQAIRVRALRDRLLVQAEEQRRMAQGMVDELETQVRARTRELEGANAYNRSLFEASIDPIVTITPDGKIGDVNAATEAMTGYSRADLIGKEFSGFFTDAEKARAGYQRVFREGKISDYELEIRNRDGRVTPVLYNASVYTDESLKVKGIIAAARDITRRRQSEARLRENARGVEIMAEISHLLAEAGPNYQPVLQTVAEMAADLFGGACLIHLPADGARLTLAAQHRAEFSGVPDELIERVFRTKQAHFLPEEPAADSQASGAPGGAAPDDRAEPSGVMITPLLFQDSVFGTLTVARAAPAGPFTPEEITLIGTVADRIAPAITNSRLYSDLKNALAEEQKARQQLVRTEKLTAMGRLLGSVAHELNNPLQTIKNCLYLVQQEAPAVSSIQSYIGMASSETERLVHLVAELRELYRPRPDHTPSLCDLVDILREVRSLMAQPLYDGKVRWEQAADAKGYIVRGEKERIQQVFINLATNAIEALQPAGGTLNIELIHSEDNRQAGVVFRDTGPGVPAEIIGNLFEPFITTKSTGLGLGLSICYEIAQKHGGHISVENPTGGGAAFTFWIPLASGERRARQTGG